ncbi:MAG: hypothetical protein RIS29_1080 [Bacteroidota bacterium]|jgi:hypothetical protein
MQILLFTKIQHKFIQQKIPMLDKSVADGEFFRLRILPLIFALSQSNINIFSNILLFVGNGSVLNIL